MENGAKPLILIVDDVPKNLQLLGTVLYQQNYEIAMADNGSSALAVLEENRPDLILLDIMMPEMDGFEVCEIIKNKPDCENIPIIFLTAKTDIENIVRGFELGAVDYITKPFNSNELLARVKTHIELKKSREKIIEYARQLEIILKERSEFLGIAAHDMKNPLNSIIGFTNLTIRDISESEFSDISLKNHLLKCMNTVKDTANFMYKTVNELLNTETLESGRLIINKSDCLLGKIINSVIIRNKVSSDAKKIDLYTKIYNEAIIFADEGRIREIADNLISNAIKYSPHGKKIFISLTPIKNYENIQYKFSVKDEGVGLTESDKKYAFERFHKLSAQPTAGESSTGLGLSIVKKLAQLHEAEVGIESEYGEGAEFFVIFPAFNIPSSDSMYEFFSRDYELFKDLSLISSKDNIELQNLMNDPKYFIFDNSRRQKLESVLIRIDNNIASFWDRITKTNIINDIIRFSFEIRELGKKEGIKILEEYGERLNEEARNFDIEQLPMTLGLFPEIVRKLKDCIV
ncbi:MAG: hypothetical protein QG635_229 [Bacteroidota bacterium]|nr:hypothetical protein [Bacteroidota bacterium]